jgi:tetratricopeptide (TPR) repeat protein
MRERNLISTQVLADAGTVDPMELTRLGVDAAKKQHFERGLILLSEAYRIFSLGREVTSEAAHEASWENEPEVRRRAPGVTFSYYGLCLACTTSTRADEAAKFCEIAIQKEPIRAEHYVNLARIWQAGRKRQKMVQALQRGLAALPKSPAIKAVWAEIGVRRLPPLSFLPRSSKVNTAIGKVLGRRPKV